VIGSEKGTNVVLSGCEALAEACDQQVEGKIQHWIRNDIGDWYNSQKWH
jgi:hypothetical protein